MTEQKTKLKETELGLIPENWQVLKARDFCFKVADGTHDSPKQTNQGKYLITSRHLKNNKIDFDNAYLISDDDFDNINKRSKVDTNDILYSMIGTVGDICQVKERDINFAIKNIGLFKSRSDLGSNWLYYYLQSNQSKEYLASRLAGSTQSYITLDQLREFPIAVPPADEQQKIAKVLGALDEKIELNRKMNKTLESLAQAVFKKWFIDGADPNWETKKLTEIANIRKGLSYKGKDLVDASENALAGIKCFKRGGGFNPEGLKPFVGDYKNEHLLNTGDLVVAMTDLTQAGVVLGKPALVPSINETNKIIASLDIVALDPIAEVSKEFLYLLLLRQESQDYLWGYSNGSTVLHLSINGLREFPVLVPDKNILAKFDLVAKPLFQSIQNNENQTINLTQIRDSLLPRLMSGKLRVK